MGTGLGRVAVLLIFFISFFNLSAVYSSDVTKGNDDPHQKSLQVQFGTSGGGVDFKYELRPWLAGRAGVTGAIFSKANILSSADFKSQSQLSARFSNIHLLADISFGKKLRAVRLVTGAAYFARARGEIIIKPSDTYFYGDIPITPQMLGDVKMDIRWEGVAPYLGLGLIKCFPNRRFNLNMDLGSYYLQSPQSRIVGTGLLQGNNTQESKLQYNLREYRFLPVLQLNFNFKL